MGKRRKTQQNTDTSQNLQKGNHRGLAEDLDKLDRVLPPLDTASPVDTAVMPPQQQPHPVSPTRPHLMDRSPDTRPSDAEDLMTITTLNVRGALLSGVEIKNVASALSYMQHDIVALTETKLSAQRANHQALRRCAPDYARFHSTATQSVHDTGKRGVTLLIKQNMISRHRNYTQHFPLRIPKGTLVHVSLHHPSRDVEGCTHIVAVYNPPEDQEDREGIYTYVDRLSEKMKDGETHTQNLLILWDFNASLRQRASSHRCPRTHRCQPHRVLPQ